MKVKYIKWVKNEGYKIAERELGTSVIDGKVYNDRDYELRCYEKFGDEFCIIQESKKLDTYEGLSDDYKFDRKIFMAGGGHEITTNKYEALKFVEENWTSEWSKSPYSMSFYSSKEIGWGYKPEGSLRVSEHWNFGYEGEHCPTAEPVEGWAVCRFENGKYHLVQKF